MILVESLPDTAPSADSVDDPVVLTWEERARTRQRLTTRGGRQITFKLPTGTRLPPGTVVHLGDGFHVSVEAAIEEVWSVQSADRQTLLRVAYEIGNRHFPICIAEDEIVVLYDHTLVELWERLGVSARRGRAPFLCEQRPAHHH